MTGVAERAGVDRLTVYCHFPTKRDLFAACSSHALTTDPPPDPSRWREITDPQRRLKMALLELYAYSSATRTCSRTFSSMPRRRRSSASSLRFGARTLWRCRRSGGLIRPLLPDLVGLAGEEGFEPSISLFRVRRSESGRRADLRAQTDAPRRLFWGVSGEHSVESLAH